MVCGYAIHSNVFVVIATSLITGRPALDTSIKITLSQKSSLRDRCDTIKLWSHLSLSLYDRETFTMSQSQSPPCSESYLRRRTRRRSLIDQLYPRKRQRQSQQARSSPPPVPSRPQSAGSSASSVSQYYGIGDEYTLGNLFASYPQTFTTFPQPHGSQGLHEPSWELRFDHEIYLSNDFLAGQTQLQRVRCWNGKIQVA